MHACNDCNAGSLLFLLLCRELGLSGRRLGAGFRVGLGSRDEVGELAFILGAGSRGRRRGAVRELVLFFFLVVLFWGLGSRDEVGELGVLGAGLRLSERSRGAWSFWVQGLGSRDEVGELGVFGCRA